MSSHSFELFLGFKEQVLKFFSLYIPNSKLFKLMVLFTGIGVITTLLGLNILACIGLVIFIYCIIRIFAIIIVCGTFVT